jgi:hypothetical protein
MRHHLLVAASVVAVTLAGCSEGKAEAAGSAVSRTYPVGGFNAITVSGPFDVRVVTGKPVSVSASGPQKLLDQTEVVVEGGKLLIRSRNKGWFQGMNWNSREPFVFTVSVPALQSAVLEGSGDVEIDQVRGDRFTGAVTGSGDLRLRQVAVGALGLSVTGSGDISAAGQAREATYAIAGSGDVDASNLRVTDAAARVAGSGNIRAQVTGTARANVAGSGDIDIKGGARCQTRTDGSGEIRCS